MGERSGVAALVLAGMLLAGCGSSPAGSSNPASHHRLRPPVGGATGIVFPTTTTLPLSSSRLAALDASWCRIRAGSGSSFGGSRLPVQSFKSGPGQKSILGIRINSAETWVLWKVGTMSLLEVTARERSTGRKPGISVNGVDDGSPSAYRIEGLWARGVTAAALGCALSRSARKS